MPGNFEMSQGTSELLRGVIWWWLGDPTAGGPWSTASAFVIPLLIVTVVMVVWDRSDPEEE